MKAVDGLGQNLNIVCNIFLHDHSLKTVSVIIRTIYISLDIWKNKTFLLHPYRNQVFLVSEIPQELQFLKKTRVKCFKLSQKLLFKIWNRLWQLRDLELVRNVFAQKSWFLCTGKHFFSLSKKVEIKHLPKISY